MTLILTGGPPFLCRGLEEPPVGNLRPAARRITAYGRMPGGISLTVGVGEITTDRLAGCSQIEGMQFVTALLWLFGLAL